MDLMRIGVLPRDQRVLLFGVSREFGWGVVVVLVGGGDLGLVC